MFFQIIGFQAVQKKQLAELAKCLSMYKYYPGLTDHSMYHKYNPIFYKHSRYIKVIDKGTFWLSNTTDRRGSYISTKYNTRTSPRICTWMKVIFAEKKTDITVKKHVNKFQEILLTLQRLLNIRTNGNGAERRRSRLPIRRRRKFRRPRFIWSTIYIANTQLENRYEDVALQQMAILKENFREVIMKRRRYPLIFMGDLGWNYESNLYKLIDDQGWMIDAVKFAAKSSPLKLRNKDYIMQNRLKSLLSGIMFSNNWPDNMRVSTNHPLFAAFLTERSPMKENKITTRKN